MSARRKRPSVEDHVEPTIVDGPLARGMHDEAAAPAGATTIVDPPKPAIQVISKMDRSGPIQVISMKTPGAAVQPAAQAPTPVIPRPKLRAVSEITPANQQNLGHVAPPYDPDEARARKLREYVVWGCIAVILASAIALIVWFAAR